ncbi:MAG: hypothetical protein V7K62_19190 [Nostoc sp.]
MTQYQASQPLLRQAYASSLGKVMGKVTSIEGMGELYLIID